MRRAVLLRPLGCFGGRYRLLRMPFGNLPAPEEFQKLDEALSELKGCKVIADDILVFGCGEMESEACEDHDVNLLNIHSLFLGHLSSHGG